MASARILTQLLRSDNIAYKIRPVSNFTHVLQAADEFNSMDIKTVFLLNCGAVINIYLNLSLKITLSHTKITLDLQYSEAL